jgi:hypothetical protein
MKDSDFSFEAVRFVGAAMAWILGTVAVAATIGVFLGIVVRVARAVSS